MFDAKNDDSSRCSQPTRNRTSPIMTFVGGKGCFGEILQLLLSARCTTRKLPVFSHSPKFDSILIA